MKNINLFEDFSDAKTSLDFTGSKMINLLHGGSFYGSNPLVGFDEILRLSEERVFNMYSKNEMVKTGMTPDFYMPTLGFSMEATEALSSLLQDDSFIDDRFYNKPSDLKKIEKIPFYKYLQSLDSEYLAKTVYSLEEAKELKYPVIAKDSSTWQSKGVNKFDTFEALEKEYNKGDVKYDIFQECIDIKYEWRAIVFKGIKDPEVKILTIYQRDPKNEKAKDLRLTEGLQSEESSKFKWSNNCPSDYFDEEQMKEVKEMIQIASECSDSNFYSVDFTLDKDGYFWFLELNDIPGMVGHVTVLAYLAIYKDFYNLSLAKSDTQKIKNIMYQMMEFTKNALPFSYDNELIENEKYWYGY
jgi:hypothetical protein